MPSDTEAKPKSSKVDYINRGVQRRNWPGTAAFFGLRVAEPFLQYAILARGLGNPLIERLGGRVLPQGPPLLTNTFVDRLGLSPYRSILLAMSVTSVLKQNLHLIFIMQEPVTINQAVMIGAFNALFNSLNSLFFICQQTSASVNGEHFPQTPLVVGSAFFCTGILLELVSEFQRHVFKQDPKNKGKVYRGGLFSLSRHINYFGYTLWRGGYALAAGGWLWGAIVTGWFAYDFTNRGIPVLQEYLEQRYGEQYQQYERDVPYRFVPLLY